MLTISRRAWLNHLPIIQAGLVIASAFTVTGCGGHAANPVGPDAVAMVSGNSSISAAARAPNGADKIDICHRRAGNDFVLMSVAQAAVPAHISHGDGLVGGPAPEEPAMRFDENCQLQVTSQIIAPSVEGTIEEYLLGNNDGLPDQLIPGTVQVHYGPYFQHRGILEFDISSLSQPVSRADLELPVYESTGPYPLTINVMVYVGDGSLRLSDYLGGTPVSSFSYAGGPHQTLDVTAAVNSLVEAGASFAGFVFRIDVPSPIELNGPFVAFRSVAFPPATSLVIR